MNYEKEKQELAEYRSQQRDLRKKIDTLRNFLSSKGIDPDPPRLDLEERNKAIYSRHLDGLNWTEIAKEFKLSSARIKTICKRVEYRNAKKAKSEMEED